jgi:hypothetical protein
VGARKVSQPSVDDHSLVRAVEEIGVYRGSLNPIAALRISPKFLMGICIAASATRGR